MPALPVLSGREAVRVFEKLGWEVARQRGSHIILVFPWAVARETVAAPDQTTV
jgi:predicted RNA binding protein YcfA (HicA-like mRNA interferase family)